MARSLVVLCSASFFATTCDGHGHLTLSPSRNGGSLANAGSCENGACFWFSQPAMIPGEPTNNAEGFRTYNIKVSEGQRDWSRQKPWRAPGSAPIMGSGCGLAGGNKEFMPNGGISPEGIAQGADGST